MLEQVLDYIHNYFVKEEHTGVFTIQDGSLVGVNFLLNNQYFKIEGSVLNDGVYKYPSTSLADEEFSGKILAMAVPPSVVAIASEIDAWVEKYGDSADSPYNSESFGGYSYTKSSSGSNGNGGDTTGWRGVFGSRLNHWRKIS